MLMKKPHPLLRKFIRDEPGSSLPVASIIKPQWLVGRFLQVTYCSTQKTHADGQTPPIKNLAKSLAETLSYSSNNNEDIKKTGLAKNLASLVQQSYESEPKPRTRLEAKKFLENRIKKRVKEQYKNGKFQDLMKKVISDPSTLKDAYDCIRVTSNVDLASKSDSLPFESMADELSSGNFNVSANTYSISTKGSKEKKQQLVFPKLKLRVVQEAVRIVLEVVYRPHFSKISHGLRSGRGHLSALRYIRKEIQNPDWWFTLVVNKKVDDCILGKLFSSMEDRINDAFLYGIIKDMFDAKVLNLEFGGFPKGHGLPQEGILSPILMNIYLDLFDREVYRLTMQYETSYRNNPKEKGSYSKLRGWFRRQISGKCVQEEERFGDNSNVRVHCCRFMDEIFFAVSGPKETAQSFKSEVEKYLKNDLYLGVDNEVEVDDILACDSPHGVKFLGTLIKRRFKESPALQAVHKLKEKVKIFAEQKQESWDEGTARIGKKWLGHGLRKVKESEIEHLADKDKDSVLNRISCYRKPGMKTDHWYKELLKIWMRDVDMNIAKSEEILLAKSVVEPALPRELRDAYYEFQKQVEEYVTSENDSTRALLPGVPDYIAVTEFSAPVKMLTKRLHRYGLINQRGYGCTCHFLMLLDDDQIISWYLGLVRRWLRWYSECENIDQVKEIIVHQVRMSCVRTLAGKYRIHEVEIEKKFDSELSMIPSSVEIEVEVEEGNEVSFDGSLMYGISYSGLSLVSLARKVGESRPCGCFVVGCLVSAECVYTVHVMERQRFPGWKTGFSSCIHPSLHRRRMGLCEEHLVDLFLGNVSLQSIDFGGWR